MAKYKIGFDLGGSSLKYGFGNATDGLLYFHSKPHTEMSLNGLKNLFKEAIEDVGAEFGNRSLECGMSNAKWEKSFDALCIASPGIINHSNGSIIGSTPNLPFIKDISLTALLSEIVDIPIYIDNDANLMTLGEASVTAMSSSSSPQNLATLGITIGSGIGTGYVINNQIFHGSQYKAMEAGHIIVVPNGRQCLCGKKGCFEAYCSSDSIKRIVYEHFPAMHDLSINTILSCTEPDVVATIREILDIFAIAISNLVMTLNPSTVVLGGGVIEIPAFDFDYLKRKVYSNVSAEFNDFTIQKAQYGNKAGVIGAILYCHSFIY